jgi:hypothetical protein
MLYTVPVIPGSVVVPPVVDVWNVVPYCPGPTVPVITVLPET